MMSNVDLLKGQVIALEELSIPKARDVALVAQSGRMNWVHLVECRRHGNTSRDADIALASDESVILDLEVELPQRLIHEIKQIERIQVRFDAADVRFPEAFALRKEFPRVPHTNLRQFEYPQSLCLSDKPYDESKLSWTAPTFVEGIRNWLAQTATGTLHAADQPLEPLLWGGASTVVLPSDLFERDGEERHARLVIRRVNASDGTSSFVARRREEIARLGDNRSDEPLVVIAVRGEPQQHGVIRSNPNTLLELHSQLQSAQINLLETLREHLREWREDKDLLRAALLIVAYLPKTRVAGGAPEATESRVFFCANIKETQIEAQGGSTSGEASAELVTLLELGEHLGLWVVRDSEPATLIFPDNSKQGEQVEVGLLNPAFALSRELAALYNGLPNRTGKKIAAVGMGSLGSQVFFNLVRAGFGEWSIIDCDRMLPHNLARHALFGVTVGMTKVEALAYIANTTIDGEPIVAPIAVDVLHPGKLAAQLNKVLNAADMIYDISASVPVARHLAHEASSTARRVSLFLNPSGTDSVLLAEDVERKINLASLEMQYYRLLVQQPALREHLRASDGRVRYAHSCRDLSNTISQEDVALHAAIVSRALRQSSAATSARITVWQADGTGTVSRHDAIPSPTKQTIVNGWAVCTDAFLIDKVRRDRAVCLPRETGGVLLGSFDMQRRIIYVVDTLPSPLDSEEHRTSYLRGSEGLREQVAEVERLTAGNLRYVGEWHSHPEGYRCAPSGKDRKLFRWLADHMSMDGLPPLMLIVAGDDAHAWFVETINKGRSPRSQA